MKAAATLAPIKPILRIADVCDLLRISEAQFFALRDKLASRGLLREIVPAIDGRPRYHGAPFVDWLSDRKQTAELMALVERRA